MQEIHGTVQYKGQNNRLLVFMPVLPHSIDDLLPLTALAPMQDVTSQWFMKVVADYGAPDYFVTEFFRINETSRLEKPILSSITENNTGRPIFAQIIGEDIPALVRNARELCQYEIAGIDLNLGCPAPRVYRKNVGGGLLRDPERVDRILGALREAVDLPLTVKMRLGFEQRSDLENILKLVDRHNIDLVSLHGRTVKDMYRGTVDYQSIAKAVATVNCPVLANGNISSASRAIVVLRQTQAAGVMVGRWAIGNPWIFSQIRQTQRGETLTIPTFGDVREYIDKLWHNPMPPERARVGYLKLFLNYIGQNIDADGAFLRQMRLAQTAQELFAVCDRILLQTPQQPLALCPYPNAATIQPQSLNAVSQTPCLESVAVT
jgi:nifR3 family TIM-barrel protein